MPLTSSGESILGAMKKKYGAKKGKEVFYATMSKGKKGSDKWHAGSKIAEAMNKREKK